ncbi:MAG: response regulator [Bacteroidota bacterium]
MKEKTILLVEDDYLDVESVKRALKKTAIPHILHVAHNGADALEMLTGNFNDYEKFTADVILLDINMPKMNGIEFLQIIKNYYSLKDIKIYIITTSAEEYDMLSTQQLGVAGYIIKPMVFNEKRHDDAHKLLLNLTDKS